MRGWRHAFALDRGDPPLKEDEERLLDRLAKALVRRRLSAPAILFLESLRPLHFIGSQALVFFAPFAKALVEGKDYDTLTSLLERRIAVDGLLRRIEGLEAEVPDA
ncbi:MAG: hypothetical protein O6952_03180 [Planctomycetota bacterium]|nr:hypothetical protein [Planctomycetota bacterium]